MKKYLVKLKNNMKTTHIDLLRILKKRQLTHRFSKNTDGFYEGTYSNENLSKILSGKKHCTHRYEKAIIADVQSFLEKYDIIFWL